MTLLRRIERYLRRSGLAPTRLGREVAGDPRFVLDLRRGRTPRPGTEARISAWLDAAERELGMPRWRG
ncbi:MAG: hypothetical protein ACK4K7_07300 [Allosphingosinicella sp.]|uniref:hypothetical protein n=1 Tax=Allosphingosinicella sp. TaxID=2823234 RepID=UPI003954F5DE